MRREIKEREEKFGGVLGERDGEGEEREKAMAAVVLVAATALRTLIYKD